MVFLMQGLLFARNSGCSFHAPAAQPQVIHLMRSMEYQDEANRPIFLRNIIEAMGQFPYASPTVFNFYLPEFRPEDFPEGNW